MSDHVRFAITVASLEIENLKIQWSYISPVFCYDSALTPYLWTSSLSLLVMCGVVVQWIRCMTFDPATRVQIQVGTNILWGSIVAHGLFEESFLRGSSPTSVPAVSILRPHVSGWALIEWCIILKICLQYNVYSLTAILYTRTEMGIGPWPSMVISYIASLVTTRLGNQIQSMYHFSGDPYRKIIYIQLY